MRQTRLRPIANTRRAQAPIDTRLPARPLDWDYRSALEDARLRTIALPIGTCRSPKGKGTRLRL